MRARAVVIAAVDGRRCGWSVWRTVPERCAEICVMEVFGDAVVPGESAAVGMGLHPFRDPEVARTSRRCGCRSTWPSSTPTPGLVVGPGRLPGRRRLVRLPGPPPYPLQLMLAVFDFPDHSVGGDDELVPELVVDWVRGYVRRGADGF